MRTLTILFLLVLVVACKPYKLAHLAYEIPIENYVQIANSSNCLMSFNDLPRRIKNIYVFKEQSVTTDSIYFNHSPQTTSLFLYGAYDKKTKAGYIIQRFYNADNKLSNQCTLFIVRDDSLSFNFYGIPKGAFAWNDIKPHVNQPKEKLFGGGIIVFKVKKQIKK